MKLLSSKIETIFSEKYLLISLLMLSIILNLFLVFEVKRLKSSLSLIQSETRNHQIMIGKSVPSLDVQDLDGKHFSIDYTSVSKPMILYVFSPDCHWCERNLQNIKYLYENTKNQYNFVGLSIEKESVAKYKEEKDIPFPIFYNPSESNKLEYNFRSSPSTYVISSEGQVLGFWSGAFGNETQKNIESYFGMTLPGLNE
jgi:peroxiredoxin